MRPVHNSVTSCDTDSSPTSQNLVSLILGKVPQTPVIPTAQCHDLEFRDLNSGIPELREALFITGRERQESLRDHLSVQPFLSVYPLPRQRTVSSPSGKTEGEGGRIAKCNMAEQEADRGRANSNVSHSFCTRQAEKGAGSWQLRWRQKRLLLPGNRAQGWGSSHPHRLVGSCLCPCAGLFLLPPRCIPRDSSSQSPASLSSPSLAECALPAEFSLDVRDPGLHLSLVQPSITLP